MQNTYQFFLIHKIDGGTEGVLLLKYLLISVLNRTSPLFHTLKIFQMFTLIRLGSIQSSVERPPK